MREIKDEQDPPLQDEDLMPCGKHKGTRMDEVPASYYLWLYKEVFYSSLKFRGSKMSKVVAYMYRNLDRINAQASINDKKNMDWKKYFKK